MVGGSWTVDATPTVVWTVTTTVLALTGVINLLKIARSNSRDKFLQ